MQDLESLVAPLSQTAREAGAAIMEHYRGGAPVPELDRKSDNSHVTLADHAAEAVIVAALAALTPEIQVVAEEFAAEHGTPDAAESRFWLVDPLDGTKEFVHGRDEFTVNIALVERGAPVLGIVYLPARDLLYAGSPAGATVARAGGAPQRIAARRPPPQGLTICASRSHANKPVLSDYLAKLTVEREVIAGSSLKFCVIAEGQADLYPRFGPTMEWDTAAGHAVLAAAGGSVHTVDGKDLAYGKDGFRNPHFIARGLPS